MADKDRVKTVVDARPDDATFEEIVRELAFSAMVDRGLKNVREGRTLSNQQMGRRIVARP